MRLAAVLALLALAGAQAAPSTPGQVIIRPEIPALTTLAPTSGLVGSSVVLTGNNFGPAQENSLVTFNGAPAVTIAWSNTSITALVPPAGTTGPVMVVRGGVSTVGLPFTVIPSPPPTLTSLSVITGPPGTPVTLTGTNFGATQGTSVVTFNGAVATPTSWSTTSIVTTVPVVVAGAGPVHVVVLGQTSNNLTFVVTVQPVLTSLNTTSGPVGTPVTLTGTNFGAVQNSSLVFFNGVPATTYSAWSATSVTTAVPTGATTGPVTILVLGVSSNGITFTVTTTGPVLTSLNPTSGAIGSTLVLTGTGFGATQGTSTVTVNGVVAMVSGTSPLTVPAASCSAADIQAAVNTALTGTATVVTVPAGPTCVWTAGQVVFTTSPTRTIQLRGAGIGQTVIDATALGGGSNSTIFTGRFGGDISGFTIICGQIRTYGAGWRIHHNALTCNQLNYAVYGSGVWANNTNITGINGGTAPLNGLIDQNQFTDQRVLVERWASGDLAEQNGATLWSEPLGLGGPNAVYAEHNTFTALSFGNVIDCQESGEYVFRDNIVHDTYPEAHTPRGYFRGCRKWEIYNNTFTQSALTVSSVAIINGGTGVIFNNTWTGTFGGNTGTLAYQRAYVDDGPNSFGLCNGLSPFDGNQDATGWPCIDQMGRSTDPTPFNGFPPPYPTHSQSSVPAYFWNNTINGNQLTWTAFNAPTATRVVSGRDYFTSPSTAMPSYTPYTDPHPLSQPATGWSDTQISVTIPAGATTGQVRVTVGGVPSNGIQFTVM
jgi:hypothetical protein